MLINLVVLISVFNFFDLPMKDLMVNKLVTLVDHLRGDISMYEAQITAQREETKAAVRTLTEASTELEVCFM